jgi:hypothetical protein
MGGFALGGGVTQMTDPTPMPPADVLARWLELATADFVTVRMPGTNEIAFRFCPQTLTVEVQRRGVKHYFPLATLCKTSPNFGD